jgi:hypothetical protein
MLFDAYNLAYRMKQSRSKVFYFSDIAREATESMSESEQLHPSTMKIKINHSKPIALTYHIKQARNECISFVRWAGQQSRRLIKGLPAHFEMFPYTHSMQNAFKS